jgi:hypothetical protein
MFCIFLSQSLPLSGTKKKSSSVSHQNYKKKLPPPTQETPLETAEEKAVAEKED